MLKQIHRATVGLICAFAAACGAQLTDTVELDSGRVSSSLVSDTGVRSFRGLPFAAPPVGENRWRAPQPVAPWDGVRDSLKREPAL